MLKNLINYFFMFLKEVSCAHQGYNYLIKNTVTDNRNIVKYDYNFKINCLNLISSCNGKAEFLAASLKWNMILEKSFNILI